MGGAAQLAADRDGFASRFGEASAGNVMAYMALDPDNVSSIRSSIRLARENARATRPELTTEVWEGINKLISNWRRCRMRRWSTRASASSSIG